MLPRAVTTLVLLACVVGNANPVLAGRISIPCTAHSDCPDTRYCNEFEVCSPCRYCPAIAPIDAECPLNCVFFVSTTSTTTGEATPSPTTPAVSTTLGPPVHACSEHDGLALDHTGVPVHCSRLGHACPSGTTCGVDLWCCLPLPLTQPPLDAPPQDLTEAQQALTEALNLTIHSNITGNSSDLISDYVTNDVFQSFDYVYSFLADNLTNGSDEPVVITTGSATTLALVLTGLDDGDSDEEQDPIQFTFDTPGAALPDPDTNGTEHLPEAGILLPPSTIPREFGRGNCTLAAFATAVNSSPVSASVLDFRLLITNQEYCNITSLPDGVNVSSDGVVSLTNLQVKPKIIFHLRTDAPWWQLVPGYWNPNLGEEGCIPPTDTPRTTIPFPTFTPPMSTSTAFGGSGSGSGSGGPDTFTTMAPPSPTTGSETTDSGEGSSGAATAGLSGSSAAAVTNAPTATNSFTPTVLDATTSQTTSTSAVPSTTLTSPPVCTGGWDHTGLNITRLVRVELGDAGDFSGVSYLVQAGSLTMRIRRAATENLTVVEVESDRMGRRAFGISIDFTLVRPTVTKENFDPRNAPWVWVLFAGFFVFVLLVLLYSHIELRAYDLRLKTLKANGIVPPKFSEYVWELELADRNFVMAVIVRWGYWLRTRHAWFSVLLPNGLSTRPRRSVKAFVLVASIAIAVSMNSVFSYAALQSNTDYRINSFTIRWKEKTVDIPLEGIYAFILSFPAVLALSLAFGKFNAKLTKLQQLEPMLYGVNLAHVVGLDSVSHLWARSSVKAVAGRKLPLREQPVTEQEEIELAALSQECTSVDGVLTAPLHCSSSFPYSSQDEEASISSTGFSAFNPYLQPHDKQHSCIVENNRLILTGYDISAVDVDDMQSILHAAEIQRQLDLAEEGRLSDSKGKANKQTWTQIATEHERHLAIGRLHRSMIRWRRVCYWASSLLIIAGWLITLIFMGSVPKEDSTNWLKGCLEFVLLSAIITVPAVLLVKAFIKQFKLRKQRNLASSAQWKLKMKREQKKQTSIAATMTKAMLFTEVGRAMRVNFDIYVL
eukprot:m.73850 g.73850  ORF g.73850 m.73850 type:complete len:1054 (+) comp12376_c1_seq4:303-3464(+)